MGMSDVLNLISKPHLVDLLRYFDRQMLLHPRIRYASVRSKPELIRDLLDFFTVPSPLKGDLVRLEPRRPRFQCPELAYHLPSRRWTLNGTAHDFPRETRARPAFRIVRRKVSLRFEGIRA